MTFKKRLHKSMATALIVLTGATGWVASPRPAHAIVGVASADVPLIVVGALLIASGPAILVGAFSTVGTGRPAPGVVFWLGGILTVCIAPIGIVLLPDASGDVVLSRVSDRDLPEYLQKIGVSAEQWQAREDERAEFNGLLQDASRAVRERQASAAREGVEPSVETLAQWAADELQARRGLVSPEAFSVFLKEAQLLLSAK